MKPLSTLSAGAVIAAMSLLGVAPVSGQGPREQGPTGQGPMGQPARLDPAIKRTFVPLGVPAALYEPVVPGEKSHVGIFVMHSGANYITFSACTELAKRGYTVLCSANSAGPGLDRIVSDARPGVAFLRQNPGIRKVVLFGHSGGATLMTAYQVIAENGVKACQGPEKIIKCPDSLAGLPPADGVVLADANWGNAEMALFSVDPAMISNDSGMMADPELDLWNPKNGFDPAGSRYSHEFIRKFQSAVARKENELIRAALDRLAAIDAGKGRFADDEPFVVAGASSIGANNKLFAQDTRLMSHTRKAWPLLHADGSTTTEVVHSVRVPEGARSLTSSLGMGAINSTVRTFLTNSAIRVADDFSYDEASVHGVEWTSSYASPPGNVEGIKVPLLLLGMTGHWEYLAAETIYEHARSSDKTLAFVEGASHMYTPCKPCEKSPGQFGDTAKTTYDYVDKWLSQPGRF
jgi:pimeloyl-ACP methyl ester carboxylesterase